MAVSVVRMTTWPLKGSRWNMKSNAFCRRSCGTCQATSEPCARFVASKVCRTRRIVPASSSARMRSITVSSGTPERRAISANGSCWNPWSLSSETSRIATLTGSVSPSGIEVVIGQWTVGSGQWAVDGGPFDSALTAVRAGSGRTGRGLTSSAPPSRGRLACGSRSAPRSRARPWR